MKKKVLFALIVSMLGVFPFTGIASTSVKLSIEDFQIVAGEEKEMIIDLSNPSNEITLVQFDMYLPNGLSIKTNGGDYDIDMAGRTNWRKHSLEVNFIDGYYRFLLYSGSNTLIDGSLGAIIKAKLVANSSFNGGVVELKNILCVNPDQVETKPENVVYEIQSVSAKEKLQVTASPSGGEVTKGTKVTLTAKTTTGTAVSGADIYYTLNGTTPTKNSTKYTSAGITINESCTLKAIAYKDGYETSGVLTEDYTVKDERAPLLSFVSVTCSNSNLTSLTRNDKLKMHATFKNNGGTGKVITALLVCDKDMTKRIDGTEDDERVYLAGETVSVDYEFSLHSMALGDYCASVMFWDEQYGSYIYHEDYLFNIKIIEDSQKNGIKAIAAGDSYSLILKKDGTLWACGDNNGQLGDGTTIDRLSPVKVMSDVTSMAAGNSHSLILKTDGTLWTCGSNTFGQLGDGTTTRRYSPVRVMGDVESVSAGALYSFIIIRDGTMWACGRNFNGELGDGTTIDSHSPVRVMSDVVSVSAGDYHSLILKKDGTLWACGNNSYGQLGDGTTTNRHSPVKVMGDVASMAADYFHSLILKTDGTLWACGYNDKGQLGDGTIADHHSPVLVMSNVASVSAGALHSLILKTDGTLWACGYNDKGQLGDGTTTERHSPVMVMIDVASVSARRSHSLILKKDGTLWACGRNYNGQLGDGTTTDRHTPVMIFDGVNWVSPTGIGDVVKSREDVDTKVFSLFGQRLAAPKKGLNIVGGRKVVVK